MFRILKHSLLFALFLPFTFLTVSAQEVKHVLYEYYEGYIILPDGAKEIGLIQLLSDGERHEKVIFKKDAAGKKQKFAVKDLDGYKVAGKEFKSVEYEDVPFKSQNFLLIDKSGCINTYIMTKLNETDGTWSTIPIYEKDGRAVNYQKLSLNFSKNMSEFIADDEELATKVRNKEKDYGLFKLFDVIEEYNTRCRK